MHLYLYPVTAAALYYTYLVAGLYGVQHYVTTICCCCCSYTKGGANRALLVPAILIHIRLYLNDVSLVPCVPGWERSQWHRPDALLLLLLTMERKHLVDNVSYAMM